MSSTTDTAANRTETTVSNVASTMSGYISNLKDKYPGVTSKVGDGMEKARSIATEVGSEIQKSASSNNVNSPLPSDFESEVQKAAKILSSFTEVEGGLEVIPRDIIVNAKGLAIFTVVKAGFFWSGRVGSGLVVARLPDDNSWSSPSLINIGGVGFGAQVGADVTDFVIILNTDDAVNAFSRGENLTLGGNLAVSAGPVGIGHEYSGSLIEGAALFSYSKSKGLFAGVSVEGTIIIERKDANKTFYGKEISAKDILCGKTDKPSSIDILYETITRAEEEKEPKAIN